MTKVNFDITSDRRRPNCAQGRAWCAVCSWTSTSFSPDWGSARRLVESAAKEHVAGSHAPTPSPERYTLEIEADGSTADATPDDPKAVADQTARLYPDKESAFS